MTDTPKWTPGPWRFWDRTDTTNSLITNDDGRAGIATPITRIHGLEASPDEMRANALLIAAAPDLYAALEEAVEQLESNFIEVPSSWTAALAKVRGSA